MLFRSRPSSMPDCVLIHLLKNKSKLVFETIFYSRVLIQHSSMIKKKKKITFKFFYYYFLTFRIFSTFPKKNLKTFFFQTLPTKLANLSDNYGYVSARERDYEKCVCVSIII